MSNTNEARNLWLDAGRVIALTAIMLFHFYSCWANLGDGNYYPYGSKYDYFYWGSYGVEFFFALSGFFIVSSLNRSYSWGAFARKKLFRLGIPIVLCSFLTFAVFRLFDKSMLIPESHDWRNAAISCLFINPEIINRLFETHFAYINGSYWFMAIEGQFLFAASAFYYLDKKHFVRNFTLFSTAISLLACILYDCGTNGPLACLTIVESNPKFFADAYDLLDFDYSFHALSFMAGMVCWSVAYRHIDKVQIGSFLVLLLMYAHVVSIAVLLIILFWVSYAVFAPSLRPFKCLKPLAKLGESSYVTYLIHEYIGILLIHRYSESWGALDWAFPLLLILLFFLIGYGSQGQVPLIRLYR